MRQNRFFDVEVLRKNSRLEAAVQWLDPRSYLPGVIELSGSGTCNRVCVFCPRSAPDFEDKKEFIKPELFERICRELNGLDYSGMFIFSGFVEPLLDKRIYEKIEQISASCPKATIDLVTNGDVLNDTRMARLFESGLSNLLISVYDGPDDAALFEAMAKRVAPPKGNVIVRHRYLPPEQDFGITMTNRGGMMDNAVHIRPSPTEPLKAQCFYPFYTLMIDYTGECLMCTHDWGKRGVVGNLNVQTIREVWTSPRMEEARRRLINGDRTGSPCDRCDADGTMVGRKFVDAWRQTQD